MLKKRQQKSQGTEGIQKFVFNSLQQQPSLKSQKFGFRYGSSTDQWMIPKRQDIAKHLKSEAAITPILDHTIRSRF